MIEFIARRLLLLVPVLLLVSVISFSIIYISPGDTAENSIMNPGGEELTGKPWRSSGLKQGLMSLYISSILTGWAEFSAETWESRT